MISRSKYFFLFIAASAADAAAVKPNITNGLTTDFNKVILVLTMALKILKTLLFAF